MAPVHLLIDGDVIAFRAASAVQHNVLDFETGIAAPQALLSEGQTAVYNTMQRLLLDVVPKAHELGALTYQVFLSCPTAANWRFDVSSTYKSNRVDSVRPLLLDALKDYLRDEFGAITLPRLEADDAIGIAMTAPNPEGIDRIAIGRDKDFMTIPGRHYQFGNETDRGKPIIHEQTTEAADMWHLVQALAGDRIDGYPGCPGMGVARAKVALLEPHTFTGTEGKVTRGPRKGAKTIRWEATPTKFLWDCIVSHYEKAGLTAMHALDTARLARILRFGEYDPVTHEVRLWTPPKEICSDASSDQ